MLLTFSMMRSNEYYSMSVCVNKQTEEMRKKTDASGFAFLRVDILVHMRAIVLR